jgi:lipopolysaccharide export system protein LptA
MRLIWGVCLLVIGLKQTIAEEPFNFATKDDGPTEVKILADALECDQITNRCTAEGKASAQKLNDPELKTIVAHKLVAYFEKNEDKEKPQKKSENKEQDQIKDKADDQDKHKDDKKDKDDGAGMGHMKLIRLEAEGDVIMTTRDNVIQGDRAEYRVQEDLAEVFGKVVKITHKNNQLNGSYCQAYLKTGKYKIINEGSRVQALISPKQKDN